MKEVSRNFLVGLTSIGALIGLSALLMSFGELEPWINPRYALTIRTHNATGLREGGAVEYNGVPVGAIHSVTIKTDPDYPVEIVALIDYKVLIPSNVEPFAATPLIGGSARLQLLSPNKPLTPEAPNFATDGTAVIVSDIRGGLVEELTAQLDRQMQPIMESLESFNELSETYIELGNNLNELTRPQTEDDLDAGESPNLRTAVEKLNSALDEARRGFVLAQDWLGDEQLRLDVRGAVEKANRLIEQSTTAVDRYTELADTFESNANELTQKLLPVADELAATLEEVRRVAKLASDGKGTVGLLLNNPDLYNSLDDASVRLERTLVELQMLIEKFKNEGVQINY